MPTAFPSVLSESNAQYSQRSTVDADNVGLIHPLDGLVTQADANLNFNGRIESLEDGQKDLDGRVSALETTIDGGTY